MPENHGGGDQTVCDF